MTEKQKPLVLLVEDVPSQAETFAGYLRIGGYRVEVTGDGQQALAALRHERPDAMVQDFHLPDCEGFELLQQALSLYPDLPVVVITADNKADLGATAAANGAYDFLLKPFPAPRLVTTVRLALQNRVLAREVAEWRSLLGQDSYHGFVGRSPPMQAVYRIIEAVAPSKASVFILGESGTGKELAAEALHRASPRRAQPFVAINCGAIPHHLLESQIFGHLKGAFTGAVAHQIGAAQKADGGTLFLDEICDMPLDLQVKLLRFLQTGAVTPVGSQETIHVDLRVVAATNRDPQTEVAAGRFREDLYYRLHVVPLEMPPLRERGEDIPLLADYFLQKFNLEEKKSFQGFAPEVLSLFRRFEWPGNVRQMENAIHRLVALHNAALVSRDMLGEEFEAAAAAAPGSAAAPFAIQPLWLVEKHAILRTLAEVGQDVVKAAALLEVSPSTLYRKLQAWKKDDNG